MDNGTLQLSNDGDLVFDAAGILSMVENTDTTAQSVRVVLNTWKEDFNLLPEHGTDYQSLFQSDITEADPEAIIREAIFQEDAVASVETIEVQKSEERGLHISFTGRLTNGDDIGLEVVMDE